MAAALLSPLLPECYPEALRYPEECEKCLIFLVGAAGFEPATFWSQTRRDTRLRYAPPDTGVRIHASVWSGKQTSAGIEDRRGNSVADRDAKFLRCPADNLENGSDGSVRRDEPCRQGLGVLGDAQDAAVAADENHVERNIGVLHPEADFLVPLEVKQHSPPFRQLLAVHEPLRPIGIIVRNFHGEDVDAGLAGNFNCLRADRPSQAGGDKEADECKGKPFERAHGTPFTRLRCQRQS